MKDQIVEIAIEQMTLGGYRNLNFAHIAEALQTTRANLHHHFKNKEGLGLAATVQYIATIKAHIDAIVDEHDGDIRKILAEFEQHTIDYLSEHDGKGSCILSHLIQDAEAPAKLRDLAIDRLREEQDLIQDQIEKATMNGDLPANSDAEKMACRIMTNLLGMNQMGLLHTTRTTLAEAIRGSLLSTLQ